MTDESRPGGTPGLQRALGTFDLVLLYVAAIVGPRWLSTAAQYGPASVTLWVIALSRVLRAFGAGGAGTVIAHPARRRPAPVDQGGVRRHARLPRRLGLLAVEPGVLPVAAAVHLRHRAARRAGPRRRSWPKARCTTDCSAWRCCGAITLLNMLGLKRAKWVQNVGGIGTLVVTRAGAGRRRASPGGTMAPPRPCPPPAWCRTFAAHR